MTENALRCAFLDALRSRVARLELGGGANAPSAKRITLPAGIADISEVARVLRAIDSIESEAKS